MPLTLSGKAHSRPFIPARFPMESPRQVAVRLARPAANKRLGSRRLAGPGNEWVSHDVGSNINNKGAWYDAKQQDHL